MSEANEKVCYNCKHNIRTSETLNIKCHCDINGSWLSYITVMTHWCRHWSKDKAESEDNNDYIC